MAQKDQFNELGVTGLKRSGGTIYEEFLTQLRGQQKFKIYAEMRDNDPVIGAILYAIEMILRSVSWSVRGGDDRDNELIKTALDDMSHTWEDFLSEVLSMLVMGFSWHEVVLKRRLGDSPDPMKRSRFTDGQIGWRKLPIRAQESLEEWTFDDSGGVRAFNQRAEPDYSLRTIPIEKSLLFRFRSRKSSPEGVSVLRNCYRPWYLKKHIEDIEAIGIERDLAGLPVIYRSGDIAAKYDVELKKILRNVRRDEQEGILLPLAYDDHGNKLLTFELLSSAGNRQIDGTKVIDRYDKRIAGTVLADFIFLGQGSVGSFALSSDKTKLFATALGAINSSIAAVFNRIAIPRLLVANGRKTDDPPQMMPGDIESPDLEELGNYISHLAGAGVPLFPDEELENHLRTAANLPDKAAGEV